MLFYKNTFTPVEVRNRSKQQRQESKTSLGNEEGQLGINGRNSTVTVIKNKTTNRKVCSKLPET